MEETLVSCVHYSLQHNLVSNAVFMAERLYAQAKTEESKELLATSYMRQGKLNQSLEILQGCETEKNRFLYSQCALKLERLRDAEQALLYDPKKSLQENMKEESDFTLVSVPCGSAGLYLLGVICRKQGQIERAKRCFKECLQLNPFMWVAFEGLAGLGDSDNPSTFFGYEPTEPIKIEVTTTSFDKPQLEVTKPKVSDAPLLKEDVTAKPAKAIISTPQLADKIVRRIFDGPSTISGTPFGGPDEYASFSLRFSAANLSKRRDRSQPSPFVTAKTKTNQPLEVPNKPVVKAIKSELKPVPQLSFTTPTTSTTTNTNTSTNSSTSVTINTPALVTPNPLTHTSDLKPPLIENEKQEEKQQSDVEESEAHMKDTIDSTAKLLSLLRVLASGYQQLKSYRCKQAITSFLTLPQNHLNTGWVLCKIGRAYFEMANYQMASKYFERARREDSCRTEDMEIYSTCLWHLRSEVELSYLAQQLTMLDKQSPATWLCVGNCFSLQKEHENALKSFQKGALLDPELPYAHTLQAWGYVENDHWDKAMTCFRTAIGLDPNHYNAWYGLGTIYNRKQKYKSAEYHFRKAIQVNSSNSVLYCHLGSVLLADKRPEEALEALLKSTALDPKNSLANFTKAKALYRLGKFQDALRILTVLRDASPREVPLYLLMGKIYKKLGNVTEAVNCITTALDFDVKSSNEIKSLLPKIRSSTNDVSDDEDGLENLS